MDDAAEGYLNDHSRAIYLMAPDGEFLAFYSLDIEDNELQLQIAEDISYDIGLLLRGHGCVWCALASLNVGTGARRSSRVNLFLSQRVLADI